MKQKEFSFSLKETLDYLASLASQRFIRWVYKSRVMEKGLLLLEHSVTVSANSS